MKTRILGAALAATLVGCSGGYDGAGSSAIAPAEKNEITETTSAIGPPAGIELPEPVAAFYSWAQTAYSIMNFLIENGDGAVAPPDIWAIQSNLQRMNDHLVALTAEVTEIRKRGDDQNAELHEQFINDKYAAIQSALGWVAEFPDDYKIALNQVQTTADALKNNFWSLGGYFIFSDYPSPDRFDPRLATPTFVSAVSAWITIRAVGGEWKNPPLLHEYADVLDWVVSTTNASVTCNDLQDINEKTGCQGRCEEYWCKTSSQCYDAIAKTTYYAKGTETRLPTPPPPNVCPYYETPNWGLAGQYAGTYAPASYAQVAAAWRAYADM
ncbi:MAG TPA: hypothetical protein VK550_03180 [Polyangiaceae bacterium]|nr:hypothetical protein [Polyangiaceae bacterium]